MTETKDVEAIVDSDDDTAPLCAPVKFHFGRIAAHQSSAKIHTITGIFRPCFGIIQCLAAGSLLIGGVR